VIGLLTILGFSLYDTVVVFDKVQENSRGLLGSTKYTYPEAANLAVNQTLMRSINTSLIALLPVAALLFVGAGILGVGTLKDLALVLFVGLATGAYSSMFLATPWLVDIKMLDQRYKLHAQRVSARRAGIDPREGRKARKAAQTTSLSKKPAKDADDDVDPDLDEDEDETPATTPAKAGRALAGTATSAPRPGSRPGASRSTPRKRQGKRR
jgi:preprotein translocase subunit SecF